jgi:hypothetical protein
VLDVPYATIVILRQCLSILKVIEWHKKVRRGNFFYFLWQSH